MARDRLLADIDRWVPELSAWVHKRGTLWYGIFDKACKCFEHLLMAGTLVFIDRAPAAAEPIIVSVGQGKSFSQFTLGQCVDLLRGLDKQQLLVLRGHRLPGREWKVLGRVVTTRNDFEHLRIKYDESATRTTISFLEDLRFMCTSLLITTAVELEARGGPAP